MQDNRFNTSPDLGDKGIKNALHWLFSSLPIAYAIIGLASYYNDREYVVYFLLVTLIITDIAHRHLKKGYTDKAIIWLCTSIVLIVTGICTMGSGIHDITLIVFACTIVLVSFVMNQMQQAFILVLSIVAITWLALGAKYGLYTPKPVKTSGFSDFIVISVVVIVSAVISYAIVERLKELWSWAESEHQESTKRNQELEDLLEKKTELNLSVHNQVAHSLTLLREIISSLKSKESSSVALTEARVQILEIIHQEMYKEKQPKHLNAKYFLPALQNVLPIENWQKVKTQVDENIMFNVEQAMSVGIWLNEIICHYTGNEERIHISCLRIDNQVKITIQPPLEETMLAEMMRRQIKGSKSVENGLLSFHFGMAPDQ